MLFILDLKLSPSSECCMLSFAWFPGVGILCAIFLLQRWCKLTSPMKMEQTECSETPAHKIHTPGNHPKERITYVIHMTHYVTRLKRIMATFREKKWAGFRRSVRQFSTWLWQILAKKCSNIPQIPDLYVKAYEWFSNRSVLNI